MAAVNSTRTFNDDTIARIRDVLLIGLASYGEIERLSNAQTTHATVGVAVKEDLRVIHPTGAADTVSRFVDALRFLD
ncbi:MAG: hypothetical protein LGR52_15970 [Candidatus Thiosymbion ectosymbiont of Robbea hypermnestra]|nr:hypothetical protein [Candidatus Thiosymbion ectosymbiont of Robbea hypermnestra]